MKKICVIFYIFVNFVSSYARYVHDEPKCTRCVPLFVMLNMRTYSVHMGSPCTYRAYELTKFIKKSEKTYMFFPSYYVYKISTSIS
jgi:hypothetical protein